MPHCALTPTLFFLILCLLLSSSLFPSTCFPDSFQTPELSSRDYIPKACSFLLMPNCHNKPFNYFLLASGPWCPADGQAVSPMICGS